MQVVETNSDNLLKDFKVTVAAADIEARIDSRLSEVGQDARIPGFRPGKAPVSVLKQRFGPAVRGEVLEATLRDASRAASLRPCMIAAQARKWTLWG